MDVERKDMDYHVRLTTADINALCGYGNWEKKELPLTAQVNGPVEETLSLSSIT